MRCLEIVASSEATSPQPLVYASHYESI